MTFHGQRRDPLDAEILGGSAWRERLPPRRSGAMSRAKRAFDSLGDEIRDHIERETQDNIDRGMAPSRPVVKFCSSSAT